MSMSGIQISDEVVDYYSTDFKKQKKVVFFRCSLNAGGTQIVLKDSVEDRDAVGVYQERTPEESKTRFEAMKGKLTIDDPCFIVFDFWFTKGERVENKMGVISWISDECPVKKRMVYGSVKDALTRKLDGTKSIQANDMGDLEFDSVVAVFK
ncbi:Cofilin-2 [Porites harrisoni]